MNGDKDMNYYTNAEKFMKIYKGHEHELGPILRDDSFTLGEIATMKKNPNVWHLPLDLVIKLGKEYVYYTGEQAAQDPDFHSVLNRIKETLSSGKDEPYASTADAYRKMLDNNLDVYVQLYEVYLQNRNNK